MHLLEEVKPKLEIISVGKEVGEEELQQEYIHWLMIQKACEGLDVCRLKGGDPFVFGRGGEEARALSEAGIPFEVVPGVSSAIAVPAFAGIPVTHRHHAHSFMVIAGCRSHDLESAEWRAASALMQAGGTVVVLMGLSRIRDIAEILIARKCLPDSRRCHFERYLLDAGLPHRDLGRHRRANRRHENAGDHRYGRR